MKHTNGAGQEALCSLSALIMIMIKFLYPVSDWQVPNADAFL